MTAVNPLPRVLASPAAARPTTIGTGHKRLHRRTTFNAEVRMLAWIMLLLTAPIAGREPVAACDTPQHRAFDFWVGEWAVYLESGSAGGVRPGELAGHNTVTRINGGCSLHESWRGRSGSIGQSLSAFDATQGRWHQTWVDNEGLVLLLAGSSEHGSIRLSGVTQNERSQSVLNRVTWTPLPNGDVVQHWEASTDGGSTWEDVFRGRYVKTS